MNFRYLIPGTIAGHAATLVVVLSQLITIESMSVPQLYCVALIGAALPAMVLALMLAPIEMQSKASQKWYMAAHPVAHLLGFAALLMLFISFSKVAGFIFGSSALFCVTVLGVFQVKSLNSPAVKEAYARVKKNA